MLTGQDVEACHRDGYVMPDFCLADDVLATQQAAYAGIIEANADTPGVNPDFMLGPHLSAPGPPTITLAGPCSSCVTGTKPIAMIVR